MHLSAGCRILRVPSWCSDPEITRNQRSLANRIYCLSAFEAVPSFIFLSRQQGVLNQMDSLIVPLLELQRRQQMATLCFFLKGPLLLKCSIVAPVAPIA